MMGHHAPGAAPIKSGGTLVSVSARGSGAFGRASYGGRSSGISISIGGGGYRNHQRYRRY